jgi:plastocyanin
VTRRLRRVVTSLSLAGGLVIAVAACGADAPPTEPTGEAADTVISIAAANLEFEGGGIMVPAEQGFTIRLDNRDDGIPHGLAIMGGPGLATEVVATDIATGPVTIDLEVPTGLVAGAYQLICPVHPVTMVTDLTVGP